MLRVFLVWVFLSSSVAFACEPSDAFPCSADDSLFSAAIDAIQTDFAKSNIFISLSTDSPYQFATVKNNSEYPLYTVTDMPNAWSPWFTLGKKKWFILRRYSNTGETNCIPVKKMDDALRKMDQIEWDCETHDLCGKVGNPNEVLVPVDGFPSVWYAGGLKEVPSTLPQPTEFKTTQYFLYRGEIMKLAMTSELSLNENYLQVKCDSSAKIESCGDGCSDFTNSPKDFAAVKEWLEAKASLKTDGGPNEGGFEVRLLVPSTNKVGLDSVLDTFAKNALRTLNNVRSGVDLKKVSMDYLIYFVTSSSYADLNQKLGSPVWRLELRRQATPAGAKGATKSNISGANQN